MGRAHIAFVRACMEKLGGPQPRLALDASWRLECMLHYDRLVVLGPRCGTVSTTTAGTTRSTRSDVD